MGKFIVIVLDGFGIGAMRDAATARPGATVDPLHFSMAWPRVWPKFRSLRLPRSFSSSPTTAALISTLRRTTSSMLPRTSPVMRKR